MSLPIDNATMDRLVFIKQLYKLAVQQAQLPSIAAANSILMFHDAVEMLLYLLYERLVPQPNLNPNKSPPFLEYWTIIPAATMPNGEALPLRTDMSRFNDTRNSLKHKTVIPSSETIREFRYLVQTFFRDVIQNVFAIDFDSISISALISDPEIRMLLQEAETHYSQNNVEQAVDNIAIAFTKSQMEYNRRRIELTSWRERRDIPTLSYQGGDTSSFEFSQRAPLDSFHNFAKDTVKAVNIIGEILEIIQTGLDYAEVNRFKRLMPYVSVTQGGISAIRQGAYVLPNFEQYQFCYDFAVQAALYFQNLDPVRDNGINHNDT